MIAIYRRRVSKGNGVTYFLMCLLVCAGCDSRRDLATDPANSPVVVPFDLRYDEEQNAVIGESQIYVSLAEYDGSRCGDR